MSYIYWYIFIKHIRCSFFKYSISYLKYIYIFIHVDYILQLHQPRQVKQVNQPTYIFHFHLLGLQWELSFKSSHLPVMGKGGHGKGAPARWPRVQTPCDVPRFFSCFFNEKPGGESGIGWDFLFLKVFGEKEHCARFCDVSVGVFFGLLVG